jgi:hypothetical protein
VSFSLLEKPPTVYLYTAGPGIMLEVRPGNFISIWEEKKFLNISHFSKTHATDQI